MYIRAALLQIWQIFLFECSFTSCRLCLAGLCGVKLLLLCYIVLYDKTTCVPSYRASPLAFIRCISKLPFTVRQVALC